jgi:hypothetical protein
MLTLKLAILGIRDLLDLFELRRNFERDLYAKSGLNLLDWLVFLHLIGVND